MFGELFGCGQLRIPKIDLSAGTFMLNDIFQIKKIHV